MDDAKFRILLSIMSALEKEDARRSSLETGIVRILDTFEQHLTEEQKKTILTEFARYERAKKSSEEAKKTQSFLRDQEYKNMFRRPLEDDENLGY